MSEAVNESLHAFVVAQLRARGKLSLREIGEGSGVPWRTIEKIASGASPDPLVSNCEKLATYFRARNKDSVKPLVRA